MRAMTSSNPNLGEDHNNEIAGLTPIKIGTGLETLISEVKIIETPINRNLETLKVTTNRIFDFFKLPVSFYSNV